MSSKRIFVGISLLVAAVLACSLQGPATNAAPDLAATITSQALTLSAPASTPLPVAKASGPQVSVSSVTNCRTGPNTAFDLILVVNPGQSYDLVGKDSADNYWVIKNPVGGTCWLWGQYATTTGDTSSLPEVPPPAVPTAKFTKTPKPKPTATDTQAPAGGGIIVVPPIIILLPPAAPTNFVATRNSCNGGIGTDGFTPIWIEAVTLTWKDNATNEAGYDIFKGGAKISNIPADSTQFNITMRYNQGTGGALYTTFGVAAYNARGTSSEPTYDVPNCP